MAEEIGFSDDFLAGITKLNALGQGADSQAIEEEIAGLDMYQVAANSKEERDPKYIGKIEGLLRSNDTEGLRAYLGPKRAEQVQESYNAAWRKVEQDRNIPRTPAQIATDVPIGVGSAILNGVANAEAALWGSPAGDFLMDVGGIGGGPGSFADVDASTFSAEAVRENRRLNEEIIDPALSSTVKNQKKLVGLLDKEDERDHRLQAEDAAAAARGEFLPTLGAWTGRFAKDAYSGAGNTLTNPTTASQGTADAVGSMILAGGVSRGFGMVGEKVVAARTAAILEQQLALGVERTAAQQLAAEGVKALRERLSRASAAASIGSTEAAGAYQQQAESVLFTSPKELTKTSEDYRKMVAEYQAMGVPEKDAEELARNELAVKTAQVASVGTGVVSSTIGHFLPEGAQSTFVPVRGYTRDAVREGVEEFLQGSTGQLISNATTQAYVDPEKDVLDGVGTQAGAGGVLGILSSTTIKAPGGARGALASTVQGAAQVVQDRAEVKQAKTESDSLQGLVERTNRLSEDQASLESVTQAARVVLSQDPVADRRLQGQLNDLVNSGVVYDVPQSVSNLKPEDQTKFSKDQTRAEAVDAAARLLLAEKDPKEAAKLAQVFSDLMEPVRQFSQASGELQRLQESQEGGEALARYQGVLADIAALPSVQRASSRLAEVLAAGERTPQSLAALAAVDPAMGGRVSAREVQDVLQHAEALPQLTDSQQAALRGSLAILKARENAESSKDATDAQELLTRHLTGDRNTQTTSRQATVETNPVHLNDDKYSARGHVDRIIRAMVSGNTEEAKAYMHEFGNFVQHFQNKVGALNQSVQRDGENVSYQQYVGRDTFLDSVKNPKNYKHKTLFVNPKSDRSMKQARSVDQEAALMADLYRGIREAYPELNEREISQQKLDLKRQEQPPAEPKKKTKLSERVSEMSLREKARTVGTDNVTGLRTRQSWEESPRTGQKVMVLTSTAIKPVNDDPNGGHDVTNDMLRVMGAAVSKIDPNAARGGTNFILETDRSMDEVMEEVRRVLPEDIELATGEGKTLEEAFQDESKRTQQLREEKKLPERGQTAFDLKRLPETKFPEGKAEERLSQQTVDRVRGMSDEQFEEQVLMDPVTPGVLSGAGWRAIPRKASVASIDLKGLKRLNDSVSKAFGNEYLKVFSEVGLLVGGVALDFAHLSGDEYAIQADTREELQAFLDKLEKHLNENVRLVDRNTETGVITEIIPTFWSGIGGTYGEADKALNTAKRAKLAAATAARSADNDGGGVRADPGAGTGEARAGGPPSEGSVSTATQEVRPQTTAERFPNLYSLAGKVRNFFAQGLKLRPDSTRTMGSDHPVSLIRNAISVQNGISDLLGKAPRGNVSAEVAEAYQGLLTTAARRVAVALNTQLQAFLKSNYSKGLTMEQALRDGTHELTIMQRGKVLNLLEVKPDGSFGYNSALLEGAILAALQWQLSSNQRQPESRPDEVAQELGYRSAEDVPGELIAQMRQGQNLAQAKQTMASYIRRFWGVRPDPKAPMGFGEAIPEAMAAEALRALEVAGLITVNRIDLKDYPQLDSTKTLDRYVTVDSESALNSYPELLEELVVVEPEFASHYGEDEPPVADRQLSNSQVKLSEQTKAALKQMQSQQFYLNMPLVEGVLKLGLDGVVALFGNPLPKDAAERYNKGHLESLESQNRSLRSAYRELERLVGEMRNRAGDGDVAQLGKKFQYAVNSVNRIMMLGVANPQASKLMREMLLPTWSVLDMSDQSGPHYRYFMHAFAQAMGQKVHQRSMEENVQWSRENISGKLAPVVSTLSSWLKDGGAFPTTAYREALEAAGIENTPLAAMALTEVARLQSADLKAFRTPLYLESDGMTNGPFNSMGLLAVGEVTEQDIQNWRRGGLSIGAEAKTADQLRQTVGKTDLYKEGMNAAQADVNDQLRRIQRQEGGKPVLAVAQAMFTAMQHLLDGEVSWDADKGEWQFERGLGKNPSTVLVYGAGNAGIANKLVARMTAAFYEKLSAVSKVGGTWEDAALEMFPNLKPAEAVYAAEQLRKAVDVLAGVKMVKGDAGFQLVERAATTVSERADKSPQKFEFDKAELKRMQNTMLLLLVNPMKEGIKRVLGPSVFDAGDLLVKTTQLQSTVAREIYLKAINAALEAKAQARAKENGGDLKRAKAEVASEFLSRSELEEIWDGLRHVMPLVEVDGQRFLIAKNALLSAGGKGTSMYSRALDDTMRTEPYAEGIAPAGVTARPYLTIGMGDARMVRKVFEQDLPGAMQVFDGINLPVDKIAEYGSRINEAAMAAWQGDVFSGVLESFDSFMKSEEVQEFLRDEEAVQRLLKEQKVNVGEMSDIRSKLDAYALAQKARNEALSKVAKSMDQMAGTYQPHVTPGTDLQGSDVEVAEAINQEIRRVMGVKPPESAKVQGVLHPSGASVYTSATMPQYLKWLAGKVTKEEAQVLREIFKSGNLRGTRIVVGTPEQVQAFQDQEDLSSLAPLMNQGKVLNGYYDPNSDVVYLLNSGVETAVHEIVHAGTFKTVLAHYMGRETAAKSAIKHLEQLMEIFLDGDLDMDGESGVHLSDARAAIEQHLEARQPSASDRAHALNEFMAWTLANRTLVQELSKADSTFTKLAKLVQEAFQYVRGLVGGKDDFASQVRFSTAEVAKVKHLESAIKDVSLAHANSSGGGSDRLTRLADAFGQKVARYLSNDPATMADRVSEPLALSKNAAARAQQVFGLDGQAASTFQMVVMALATEAQVNPQAMTEAQELYSHLLDGLTQEDFMTGLGDEMNDRAQAVEKFEFVSGHTQSGKTDPSGRTTLLPAFMALALVDDGFRALLAKKQMPEKIREQVVGMDSAIEVAGQRIMDALSERLSGTDHPQNVREAIDQLTQSVIETTQESALEVVERLAPTSFLRSMNEKLADMLGRAGQAAGRTGSRLGESKNPISRGAATVLKAVSILSSSEDAAVVGEEALRQMDKHPGINQFFKDVVADMIGRVGSQADVYDMVKRVRKLVSQTRQAYRENLPQTMLKQFGSEPTSRQHDLMYRVMGRYDLASLTDGRTVSEVLALASDALAVTREVDRIESRLGETNQGQEYLKKVDQYVDFVLTGKRGSNLLRNAYAISELLGMEKPEDFAAPSADTIRDIDQLMTLKMLQRVPENDLEQFSKLVTDEAKGMEFTLNHLRGQRRSEVAKASQGMARFNHYKGLLPSERKGRGHVVVADESRAQHMEEMGYQRVGEYRGSNVETRSGNKSYWYSSEGGVKTTFNQGIVQNVQGTAYGVRTENGTSLDDTAGLITDPVYVSVLAKRLSREAPDAENLSPIYDQDGALVAFERTLDPAKLKEVRGEQHLAKMIGEWQGRQVEEAWSRMVNEELLTHLQKMYEEDTHKDRYVNLLGDELDPVVQDAVNIMPGELKVAAQAKFGQGQFMVRRNMLNTVAGYRSASVGDLWTGNSRWSPEFQQHLRAAFSAIPGLGKDAYRRLVWAERNWQAVISSIKTNIVVRSLIVPAANFMSGVLQLNVRGVPMIKILKAVPTKVMEVEYYSKTMAKKIELEAHKFAAEGDVVKIRTINAQLSALEDSLKRLSIWPLIEAGEFSTISDVGQTAQDLDTADTVVDRLSQAVDQLPAGLRDLARQGFMTRDTAMFQAMQKATQYSDFIMKAIYFDHLRREGQSAKSALGTITEEFNNYDVLPGRDRGYAESVGLAWFLNYKLRATKVGLSMVRKNPLNLLLYTMVSHPGSVGIPGTDNLISSLVELSLGRSFGPGMVTSPISLNPWYNLVSN
jgi:GGDEF domain-containing protein